MIPPRFQYSSPTSLKDAISLLQNHRDAKVLAGGQSLIPVLKYRLTSTRYLIDLNRIPKLAYIREEKGSIKIGALTRYVDLQKSSLLKSKLPIMVDAADVVADPIVRNVGTLGGAIAHADPAGDWGAVILALDAELVAQGPSGERKIAAAEFYVDTFTTKLKPSEILTQIRIPKLAQETGGAYLKLERKIGDFATVGVAAQLSLTKGVCTRAGVGLTAVGSKPIKSKSAENELVGKVVNEKSIGKAAKAAVKDTNPTSDIRATAEYRKAMVEVYTRRALHIAKERASK
jgi:carbon-monoxide dehydrogenase medium subunit